MPPPSDSVLDFPGQEGGVEQCDRTCNYMERQSLSEATTGLIYTYIATQANLHFNSNKHSRLYYCYKV